MITKVYLIETLDEILEIYTRNLQDYNKFCKFEFENRGLNENEMYDFGRTDERFEAFLLLYQKLKCLESYNNYDILLYIFENIKLSLVEGTKFVNYYIYYRALDESRGDIEGIYFQEISSYFENLINGSIRI